MGIRILNDAGGNQACMYCSTTEWAFGPVFYETDITNDKGDKVNWDAQQTVEQFMDWCDREPSIRTIRSLTDTELEAKKSEFNVAVQKGEWPVYKMCEDCEGSGIMLGQTCENCNGKGQVFPL